MKHLVILIAVVCSAFALQAYNYEININDDEISIKYNFDELYLMPSENDSTKTIPQIDKFGFFTEAGLLSLPKLTETFEIPSGYNIDDFSYVCKVDTINIDREIAIVMPPETDSAVSNTEAISQLSVDTVWPGEFATYLGYGIYRDKYIGSFELTPVKYNQNDSNLYFCKEMTVIVTLSPLPDSDSLTTHTYSQSDIENLTTIKLSYPEIEIDAYSNDINVKPTGYLIICPSDFEEPANKLAEWKRRLGFNVWIKSLSTDVCSSPELVKAAIYDTYLSESSLEYVLLLGGGELIMPFKGRYNPQSEYSYYTDYYFSCMDGENDVVSDFKLGRLPAESKEEAFVMVNKNINYEWNPPATDDAYYNNASHAAFFQADSSHKQSSRRFVLTSEDVLNYVSTFGKQIDRVYNTDINNSPQYWSPIYSYGAEIPAYLQKPNFQWSGTAQNLIEKINEGRFYVLYRGHGNITSFANINFSNSSVKSLNNINHLPVVFGITCLSGTFYNPSIRASGVRSISEILLTYPNGGAVAVIAASRESYSGYNDHLTGGLFNSLFPSPGCIIDANLKGISFPDTGKPKRDLGSMLASGGRKMFEAYKESQTLAKKSYSRYNMEIFHCLGDPSLKIYTSAPKLKRPLFLCEGGQNIYFDFERDVVLVNKNTNEVAIIKSPFRQPLEEYFDDFYVSLVSDNTVPILLNDNACAINEKESSIANLSQEDSNCVVTLDGFCEGLVVAMYDVYGQEITSKAASCSIVNISGQSGLIIIVLLKDGIIIDKKSTILK